MASGNIATQVKLRYALRGGQPVGVKVFEHLAGSEYRPDDLYCPECEKRVMVKLSPENKITNHFAHYPDSECPLRESGETAYHLNAKIYLAERLRERRNAALVFRCGVCENHYPYLEINDYDEVRPELKVGKRRPDISCLQASQPIGAAEIWHSHAVTFEKQYDLNATGLAWFEIPALNVHPRNFSFTFRQDVLSIDAQGAGITYPKPPVVCEVCEARRKREAAHAIEQARLKDDLARLAKKMQPSDFLRLTEEQKREAVERMREDDARTEAERHAWAQRGGAARLAENGDLVIPMNSIYRFRDWQGGQPIVRTLAELNAPLDTWRRYAARSEDLLTPKHAERCNGSLEKAGPVLYCAECKYFIEAKEAA
jgi:hypothetical protein